MTGPAPTGPAAWADTLLQSFAEAGYARAQPAILQPAEPFLDLSGEDIRKSLYLTHRRLRRGTLPASRPHHSRWRAIIWRLPRAGKPAGFSYLGPVFRYRGGQPQRVPAGRHRIVRPARTAPAADAEMLALALEATSRFQDLKDVEIRTGDVALFTALIDALNLYPGVATAADEGFQPQAQPHRTISNGWRAPRVPLPAATNTRACWRRSPAPTARRRWRWSPT